MWELSLVISFCSSVKWLISFWVSWFWPRLLFHGSFLSRPPWSYTQVLLGSLEHIFSVIIVIGLVHRVLITSASINSELCSWLGAYLESGHNLLQSADTSATAAGRASSKLYPYCSLLFQQCCSLWITSFDSSSFCWCYCTKQPGASCYMWMLAFYFSLVPTCITNITCHWVGW